MLELFVPDPSHDDDSIFYLSRHEASPVFGDMGSREEQWDIKIWEITSQNEAFSVPVFGDWTWCVYLSGVSDSGWVMPTVATQAFQPGRLWTLTRELSINF